MTSPGARLRAAMNDQTPLLLPGVHDALSARLAERSGFSVGYLSGSATAMSLLGLPDIGLLTGSQIVEQTRRVTAACELALVVDADTGFGNAVNTAYTVRELESAGAAGIQLEDQTFPKRCGHFAGKSVVPVEEMLEKLSAAVEARRDEDLVIIARTDARAVADLTEAIDRGLRYAEAGADVIFVEAPRNEAELREIPAKIGVPTLVNVVEGGKTPQLPLADYAEMGFRIVLYPTAAVRTVARGLGTLYEHLRETGTTEGADVGMVAFAERNEITGFADYEELAARAAGR
ncbi:carboxyvinyl-carboxyphosphonate phosphorylmutase [Amycolatopsis acidicola]|uniref:Carboxyvinyl-carboxyphosphonate phosphorylmutase n=1 Tax=Amycolatopsis acidicola TaxID=2596893 RepID=A0A5N0UYY0_9PSEU|nr:isocitrate lyase/phosphoenolpyruvate mutase family protein [Amycolatopsis acidicola]KAA9159054.1 carboxyvinyl-carboxyphosphonate phosphorylmutase [Amycolatopsis acidicola]